MKKLFIITLSTLALWSCADVDKFHVEGTITNAEDSVLYFENVGIEDVNILDSVKLSSDGAFAFSGERQTAPEFYRLRIDNQIINVSIDSTETVRIKADYNTMATDYSVEGSDNCTKIKELSKMQIDLCNKIDKIPFDSIDGLLNAYKDKVKKEYIYVEPFKAYAYFALFQTIGRYLIFNPGVNKEDNKAFAAVATSWDTYFPESPRSENLHNITIEGLNDARYVEAQRKSVINVSQVEETGLIDVVLPDNDGKEQKLSSLKGQVVLLYFNVFNTSDSPERIMKLRELYEAYHAAGLEIYMVSLDSNEHFWKTSTKRLPWINVRDADGIYSQYITLYNLQRLPSYFIIDRNNTLKQRDVQIEDLNKSIAAYL